MGKVLKRLPSPSMAVAFIALLAALGGTAVALPGKNGVKKDDIARNAVSSSDIRNSTITTSDVKNSTLRGSDIGSNTVTGSDVNEGSLGTVPSANTANSANTASTANSAGNANTVGGQQIVKINARLETGAPERTIFNAGGLQIAANCLATDLDVEATTSVSNSAITARAGNDFTTNSSDTFTDDSEADADETVTITPASDDENQDNDLDFDVGQTYDFDINENGGENDDDTRHEFVYTGATGSVVTGMFTTEEDTNSLGGATDCYVTGHAIAG